MLHFSCDLCGRHLSERRFVVKLEVYPAFDPEELCEEDLDVDNLAEVAAAIHEIESEGLDPSAESGAKQFRFDLCPNCHRRFVKDPLGRESIRRLNFSEN